MSYSTVATTTTGAQTLTLTKSPNEGFVSVEVYGTFGGLTFTFQGSIDGTNFVPVFAISNSTGLAITGATTISVTDNTATSWTIPNAVNFTSIRLNVTALSSVTSLTAKSFGAPTMEGLQYTVSTATSGTFGSVTSTGAITSSSSTAGVGYATGAGATVTQITSRTTGVTINAVSGAITLVSAAGSTTPASFTVTNSAVAATDIPIVVQKSGTDLYTISVSAVAAGSFQVTFNTKSGTTTEQPVFSFGILKAVTS